MNQRTAVVLGVAVLAVCLVAVAALAVWNWVLGPTLAASGPITAIPLSLDTPPSAPTATNPPAATQPVVASPAASAEQPATSAPAPAAGLVIFSIDPAASEARFSIYEELRGEPKTVVGVTNAVAGELAVDPANLDATQVGIIQINARTLSTDSDQRNRAIRNRILHTDSYEYITFAPTAITGLSGSAQPGDTLTFQIAGDLTIRDVTQPVVFAVTATAQSATQLAGLATTVVNRSDFGLLIPSVAQVANVGEQVTLELEFVAIASGG